MATKAPQTVWFMNSRVDVRLFTADNADQVSILEHHMPFGDSPPLHVHHDQDEIFVMLEGRLKFQVGERSFVAGPGEVIAAPKGVPHTFKAVSEEGVRCLTITRGRNFEAVVTGFGRAPEGDGLPQAMAPTPEMAAALGALCAANRIDLLGPPMA